MPSTLRPTLVAVMLIATRTPITAQRSVPQGSARNFSEVALSRDGSRLAWVGPRDANDRPGLTITRLDRATPGRRLAAPEGRGTESDLAWSPDGTQLAFLAPMRAGRPALFIATPATGAIRRVAELHGNAAATRWSPDGQRIALLYTANPSRPTGPLAPQARDTGVIGRQFDIQRIAVLNPQTGALTMVSPSDLYVHEFEWSPDGSRIVAAAGPGPGDSGWYVDEVWIMNADGGQPHSLGKPGMQIASPRWSPDGRRIAYVGGLMSDEGVPGGDVYVIDAAGGTARNLTPDVQVSPNWLAWKGSPNRILFTAWADGGSAIGSVDPAQGGATVSWRAGESIRAVAGVAVGGLALSGNGAVSALIRQSFDAPPEIWAGPVGEWKQVTRVNAGVVHPAGRSESLHWASDKFTVQGWLLHPIVGSASQQHPMVVIVHGGPAAAHQARWLMGGNSTERALLDRGYFVFLPNPRGSQGSGEAFTRANVKDFGYGDLRDILSGVDEAARRAPVDTARVGITGWSYGGYMSMWAVTQTNRFKVAVIGAGLANWLSYWAQNGINEWLLGYFGATVYDDPALYARSAPITFIKQARTPALLLVGEKDVETPAPQSYEFWKGLQNNGVETSLVVYADEGHGLQNPVHLKDRRERSLAWFDRYLKKNGAVP